MAPDPYQEFDGVKYFASAKTEYRGPVTRSEYSKLEPHIEGITAAEERDIQYLRDAGYEVWATKDKNGGVHLLVRKAG